MAFPLAAGAVIAKKFFGGAFQKPSPRYYGKLGSTLRELQEGVEGKVAHLNNRTYDDLQTVDLLNRERRTDSGMQGIWRDLLPGWNPTARARAAILQADPSFTFTESAGAVTLQADEPSGLSVAVEPLRSAVVESTERLEADVREGAAQTAERIGVGGGAEGARRLRGEAGPLDRVIAFAQEPVGIAVIAVAGLALFAFVAFTFGRR